MSAPEGPGYRRVILGSLAIDLLVAGIVFGVYEVGALEMRTCVILVGVFICGTLGIVMSAITDWWRGE